VVIGICSSPGEQCFKLRGVSLKCAAAPIRCLCRDCLMRPSLSPRGLAKRCETLQFELRKYPLMSKRQLIDEIRSLNPTAQPQFLAQFDEPALQQYLEHLQSAVGKHLRIGGWVRKQPKLRMVS
jgi:hypothetical protein